MRRYGANSSSWAHVALPIASLFLSALVAILNFQTSSTTDKNKAAIDVLEQRMSASQVYAEAVKDSRKILSEQIRSDQDRLALNIELLRIYALAETAPEKLAVLQMAVAVGQRQSITNIALQIQAEQFYVAPVSPEDLVAKNSLIAILSASTQSLWQSPIVSLASVVRPSRLVVDADPPLTLSKNVTVSANATLLATLPSQRSGWIFLGDISRRNSHVTQVFDVGSTTTTARVIPEPGLTLQTCQDVNLREIPFNNGMLGKPIGVVPMHGNIRVTRAPNQINSILQFTGLSKFSHKQIVAYWAYVNYDGKPAEASTEC